MVLDYKHVDVDLVNGYVAPKLIMVDYIELYYCNEHTNLIVKLFHECV